MMRIGIFFYGAAAAMVAGACSSNDPSGNADKGAEAVDATDATTPDAPAPGASAGGKIVPSNLPADTCDTPATKDLVIQGDLYNYPCDATIVQGGGAPDVCVLKGANVAIHQFTVLGRFHSAIAIVATNGMTIDGAMDVGAESDNDGNNTYYGDGPGASTTGTAGGETGSPLVGGLAGAGGVEGDLSVYGGGGGGALQLVACNQLTVTTEGTISAGGGGGEAGLKVLSGQPSGTPGGDGGSGGTLLLEAAHMTIAGGLSSNGGGGGGGGGGKALENECSSGSLGGLGGVGTAQTAGGVPGDDGHGGGRGGNGGSVMGAPTEGAPGGDCNIPPGALEVRFAGGGGKGGPVGHIRLNVPAGTTPNTTGALFSPLPSIGTVATH